MKSIPKTRRDKMSENAKDFDIIIIGGGSAGFAAAIKASQFNKKVAVVESGVIGGTCLNVGCVPTKNLLRAAEIYHFGKENPFAGINMKQVSLDFKEIIMQKDNLLAELRKEKYIDIYENDKNITLLKGKAEFINQDTIQINEKQYKTSKYIITTGSRSSVAKIDGLECVKYLTNIEIMELDKLPEKLVIIGGGWIAVEFAQMFSMFGSKVTILQRSGRIVKNEEPEISEALEKELKNQGINIVTDLSFQKVYEENNIKDAFLTMWNKLISNYEYILEPMLESLKSLRTNKEEAEELIALNNKIMELTEQSHILSRVVSKGYIDSAVFIERQNALKVEVDAIKKKRNYLLDNNGFEKEIEGSLRILDIIKYNPEIIEDYDENLFTHIVDKIIIGKNYEITFRLINKLELTEYVGK